MKKPILLALLAASGFTSLSHAAVIISSTVGNGGFVSATTGNNLSLTGWTSNVNVWVDTGNTTLSTVPFGSDTATNSRFLQLVSDSSSTILTSGTLFSLTAGDTLNLAFDLKTNGTGTNTILTVSLFDTVNNVDVYTFGTTYNTATAIANLTQQNLTASGITGSNLALRYTMSGVSGVSKDFHLDRVYLESTAAAVPEPSIALLGGLGLIGLLRRRR